ncbi:MAG: flagellar protein FlaG [Planctomycetes bacterium]|nr:flagellar protein FlaG [Planctomycetota bacterium]
MADFGIARTHDLQGSLPGAGAGAEREPLVDRLRRREALLLRTGGLSEGRESASDIDPGLLGREVERANSVAGANTQVRFELDRQTGDLRIKVLDARTDEVIRTIPPEDFLQMASRAEGDLGFLVDGEV